MYFSLFHLIIYKNFNLFEPSREILTLQFQIITRKIAKFQKKKFPNKILPPSDCLYYMYWSDILLLENVIKEKKKENILKTIYPSLRFESKI